MPDHRLLQQMRKRTITVRINLRRNPMRVMFQPDTLHNQAPSDHTRHHHAPHRAPEKTSGFNIPNALTTSLHQQPTTTRPQLSVKLSLLPSRHDTASPPFPTQTPCPPVFTHLHPTLHTFAALNPHLKPRARIRMPQSPHFLLRDTRSRGPTNTSRLPHSSLATSLPATSLPATSIPATSIPSASMRSLICPRPTQSRRFLHIPPTPAY